MRQVPLADSFRLIEFSQILFGIEAAGTPHLLSLLGVRLSRTTALRPNRLFETFLAGPHFDTDGARNGVIVTSAVLPEFAGYAWVAARLVTPVVSGAIDREPADLAFAVVGGPQSLPARQAAQSFARLADDEEALLYLRSAMTMDLFRAELTWALERTCYRDSAKMTG